MTGWDVQRAGIELYMILEGKAALKVEEVVENVDGTWNITDIWDAFDHAFLHIDHRETFATSSMRTGERMTEYLDQFVCLFRKARPGTFA